jgi:hypothetical protein
MAAAEATIERIQARTRAWLLGANQLHRSERVSRRSRQWTAASGSISRRCTARRFQFASVFLVSEAAAVARSLIFEAKSSTWNV